MKISIDGNIHYNEYNSIMNSSFLNFYDTFCKDTGEVKNDLKANYLGFKFRIKPCKTIVIQGSFHKHRNHGIHNYDDFNFTDFKSTMLNFCSDFNIRPTACKIHIMEIGINVLVESCNELLNGCLYHFGKSHKRFNDQAVRNGKYKLAEHMNFDLKIYDKSAQCKLPQEIVRWEIRFRRARYLEKMDINTLDDLLIYSKVKRTAILLESYWKQVLYFDTLIFKVSSPEYYKWGSVAYWETVKKASSTKDRNKIQREIKKFNLWKATNGFTQQKEFENAITNKISELMQE